MNEPINICFVCDEGYVMPVSVAITSLIINKKMHSKYNIYIIGYKFSVDAHKLFEKFDTESVSIKVIDINVNEISDLHKTKKGYCVATTSALLKFYIAEYFQEIRKILYLDGDIIVREDLSDLYQTKLEGYYGAVVIDSGIIYSNRERIKLYKNYFNSGVMLLNLEKMRADNVKQLLIESKIKDPDSILMDQDAFNDVFRENVKLLSIKYNCLYVNLIRAKDKFNIEMLNKLYKTNFLQLNDLKEQAVIIHYSSKDKPWKYNNIPLSDEWYKYFLKRCQICGCYSGLLKRDFFVNEKNKSAFIENYRPKIIVSLTSYPKRINTVYIPIESMLNQTVKVDKIILWLAKEEFPNLYEDLPVNLLELQKYGLYIEWCDENLKSHKKYYYALQKFPDDIIITIDDDLIYNKYLIEILLDSFKKFPRAISAMRVHLIKSEEKNKNKIGPYETWIKEYNKWFQEPSMQLFATTGAGTLFPPYSLSKEVFNKKMILENCLYADDIWLKIMQVLIDTPVVLANRYQRLSYIDGTQENALWKSNVIDNKNDLQLNNLLNKYNKKEYENIVERIFISSPLPNNYPKFENIILENKVKNLRKEMNRIYSLREYKIGQFIRKIFYYKEKTIFCIKNYGFIYTVNRIVEKIKNGI